MVLFQSGKTMYKANLHCHTTVSDGCCTPEQIKEMYLAKGYSIVAFTDHNILKNHGYLSDDHFLALNACEVDVTQKRQTGDGKTRDFGTSKVYHLNLYANDPDRSHTPPLMEMEYEDIDAINRYIRDRSDEGFLVCYNHPYWSLQSYEDYGRLKGLFAMEIYNHGCEVSDGYYGYCPRVYDEMLRSHGRFFCLSTDDNHNCPSVHNPQGDSFGGFVMIRSERLAYADIIQALRQGDFYASQGPEIYEISLEGKRLHVSCSEVCLIVVYTDGRRCFIQTGDSLKGAEFTMRGDEKTIRVMCRDKDHRDANSIAYPL